MKGCFKMAGNNLVVRLQGEIDDERVKTIRRTIDVEFDEQKAKNIVFDMTDVSFMDSSGVGMIIGRFKRAAALGGQVKVFGADRTVRRIIELSGLGRIVRLYKSEKEATEERRGL